MRVVEFSKQKFYILQCSDFQLDTGECCAHKHFVFHSGLDEKRFSYKHRVYAEACCNHIHEISNRFPSEWNTILSLEGIEKEDKQKRIDDVLSKII